MVSNGERASQATTPRIVPLGSAATRNPRFPRRILLGLVLVGVVVGVPVLSALARFSVGTVVSGNGWIQATRLRTVRARLPGRLSQVLVQSGQWVEPGQALALLDDRELRDQSTDLGFQIRLLRIDRRQGMETRAQNRQKVALDRQAARLDLNDARNELLQHGFTYLGRSVDVDSLLAHYTPGANIGIDAAMNDYLRARGRLRQLDAQAEALAMTPLDSVEATERILQLEAKRAAVERDIGLSVIRSPIRGVVQSTDLDELLDRRLSAGDGVLEVADPSSWQLHLFVTAAEVHRVQPGDSVRVTIDALSAMADRPLAATVDRVAVSPSVQEGFQGRFLVLASLVPPQDSALAAALRSGFSARGDILTEPMNVLKLLRTWLRRKIHRIR